MAVDLGSRTTKAVLLERRGEVLALTRYALLDAPIYEKALPPDLLKVVTDAGIIGRGCRGPAGGCRRSGAGPHVAAHEGCEWPSLQGGEIGSREERQTP